MLLHMRRTCGGREAAPKIHFLPRLADVPPVLSNDSKRGPRDWGRTIVLDRILLGSFGVAAIDIGGAKPSTEIERDVDCSCRC